MTEAERRLWSLLRNRKLFGHKFRRQVPLGPYFVDFVCLEARLIIEADGEQHAESIRDANRHAWLAAQGFHVARFWNVDILTNTTGVLDRLGGLMSERRQTQEVTP
jgi:very-short-patch-repair endonuclease